jgi:hypothetical protein
VPATTMTPPPVARRSVDLEGREESAVIDALRAARADTQAAQTTEIRSLAKGVITTRRLRAVWHVLTLLRDAFRRGARREKLLLTVRVLEAIINSWYDGEQLERLSDLELHIAEEMAEGAQDVAECRFFAQQSPSTAAALIESCEAHISLSRRMIAVAARYLAPARVA